MATTIEHFQEKLRRAQHVMRCRAGSIKGGSRIAEFLEKADEFQKTVDWSPEPEKPGIGEVSIATKRMCHGQKP